MIPGVKTSEVNVYMLFPLSLIAEFADVCEGNRQAVAVGDMWYRGGVTAAARRVRGRGDGELQTNLRPYYRGSTATAIHIPSPYAILILFS